MKQNNLTPRDRIKHDATRIERKWLSGSRRNLKVEKLGDKLLKESTMLFLENIDVELSAKGTSLIEEASSIGNYAPQADAGNLGNGGATVGDSNSAMYKPLSLALARRVFPSLFAHKLVGVQPMAAPVGIAFAMRNKYVNPAYDGTNDYFGKDAAWDAIPEHTGFSGGYVADASAVDGNENTVGQGDTGLATVVDLSGTGNVTDATVVLVYGAGTTAGEVGVVPSIIAGVLTYTTTSSQATLTAGEENAINNIVAIGQADITAKFAAANYALIGKGGEQSTDGTGLEANGRGLSTQNAEFLGIRNGEGKNDETDSSGRFNEVGIEFSKKLIEAVSRQLGASFSLQSMQDIKALHEIDLKMEVVEVLQYETTAELDRELLGALKTTSVTTGDEVGGGDVLVVDIADAIGANPDNRQITAVVINAIMLAANTVAKKTRRGRANFVVVAPAVASIIQSATPYFTANVAKVDPGVVLSGAESTEIGKINNQITVYLDQFATTDYALVGYKGANRVSDSGVIFSPYTMNVIQEAVAQENFQPRVGVMSRYAITTNLLDAGRYYRSIFFANLDQAYASSNLSTVTGW
jgi:hypothetical protein